MLYNTDAIVVRAIPYGETHAIVTLLSPTGLVAAMAKGAKKPQSRLAAGIVQCSEGVYSIYQRTGMGNIQQVEVLNTRRSIHEHLDLAAHAAYFCELVISVSDERPNGNPAVYRLFKGALDRLLLQHEPADVVARIWETKVLRLLGVSPDWMTCMHCGKLLTAPGWYSSKEGGILCGTCAPVHTRNGINTMLQVPSALPRILDTFSKAPWEKIGSISLNSQTRESLKNVLRTQMTQFAGLSPKSLKFLDELNF